MNSRRNNKCQSFKTHQQRQFALRFMLFLVWLVLVIVLPKNWSNIVAAAGLLYGMFRLMDWGKDPGGEPSWGCFPHMRLASIQIEIDRSLTPELKAQVAALIDKQGLLRATQAESEPKQELLRPAADAGETKPEEMLRPSDKPNPTSPNSDN